MAASQDIAVRCDADIPYSSAVALNNVDAVPTGVDGGGVARRQWKRRVWRSGDDRQILRRVEAGSDGRQGQAVASGIHNIGHRDGPRIDLNKTEALAGDCSEAGATGRDRLIGKIKDVVRIGASLRNRRITAGAGIRVGRGGMGQHAGRKRVVRHCGQGEHSAQRGPGQQCPIHAGQCAK